MKTEMNGFAERCTHLLLGFPANYWGKSPLSLSSPTEGRHCESVPSALGCPQPFPLGSLPVAYQFSLLPIEETSTHISGKPIHTPCASPVAGVTQHKTYSILKTYSVSTRRPVSERTRFPGSHCFLQCIFSMAGSYVSPKPGAGQL